MFLFRIGSLSWANYFLLENFNCTIKWPQEQVPAAAPVLAPSTNPATSDQSEKLLAEVTVEKQKLEVALEEQIMQTLSLQKELDKFKVDFCTIYIHYTIEFYWN